MQLPRVVARDLGDPLPQFKGQLDAVLFHGLIAGLDRPTAGEGTPDTKFNFFKGMLEFMLSMKDPVDELWLHHVASGTIIGGENLGWYYSGEALRNQPFMLRKMVKPDQLYIQTMARKVAEPKIVADCWRRVLAWPARTVMTLQGHPSRSTPKTERGCGRCGNICPAAPRPLTCRYSDDWRVQNATS